MKTRYLYILIMLMVGLFTVSCEDRLDIDKHGNMGSQDDFYKTDDETMQALASLYNSWGSAYYDWYFVKNLLADDAWTGGGNRGDNANMERINEYTFDTDNSMIQSLYSSLYAIIYKANLILEKVDADSSTKNRAIAEAYFFRAWSNFELVTLFGPVPLVDHLLAPDEYRKDNSTTDELWAAIESDLTEAINSGYLPSKTSADDSETTIRITKEVAEAMLGKAYLFQKKYSQAATELNKVVDSGKYALYKGEYDMLLHAAANGCCESMLEVQKRNDAEQAWTQYTMTYIMQGWRTSLHNISGEAASVLANGTYGFLNPTKSLYDAFVDMEGTDGYRLKSTIRTAEQLKDFGFELQTGKSLIGHEGYYMWKNRALFEDCIYDASYFQVLQYINLRVMRYAEVLLLAAEANLESGNTQKALECINQVRTRAQLPSLTSLTLDDVKKEKRLELCIESVRFQDLVRWGDAETVLKDQGHKIPTYSSTGVTYPVENNTYGFKAKHKLLPIPLKEMELNPNMKQNEGW